RFSKLSRAPSSAPCRLSRIFTATAPCALGGWSGGAGTADHPLELVVEASAGGAGRGRALDLGHAIVSLELGGDLVTLLDAADGAMELEATAVPVVVQVDMEPARVVGDLLGDRFRHQSQHVEGDEL